MEIHDFLPSDLPRLDTDKDDWYEYFEKLNQYLYEHAENPLQSHGIDHHRRVCVNALELSDALGRGDKRLIIAAAWLHDLGALYPDASKDEYHNFDRVLSTEVLSRIGIESEMANKIVEIIEKHGSDPGYKSDDEAVEISILRDADKMDVFGVMGVARVVMVRSLRGDTLEDIAKMFWNDGKLEKKWQSITFEVTRDITREKYEYSKEFFKRLSETLGVQ